MGLLDRFRGAPTGRVRMQKSYGAPGLDLVAGEQYDLPVPVADELIAKGYADGDFSRSYSPEELTRLRSGSQVVSL